MIFVLLLCGSMFIAFCVRGMMVWKAGYYFLSFVVFFGFCALCFGSTVENRLLLCWEKLGFFSPLQQNDRGFSR